MAEGGDDFRQAEIGFVPLPLDYDFKEFRAADVVKPMIPSMVKKSMPCR